MEENNAIVDIDKQVARDKKYIQEDLIAKQIDGNYCKFSRPLHAVAVIGLTSMQYLKYWENRYKNHPQYYDEIMQVCIDKLNNNLVSNEDMIEMIQNSKDIKSEKEKAIKLLGGKYV